MDCHVGDCADVAMTRRHVALPRRHRAAVRTARGLPANDGELVGGEDTGGRERRGEPDAYGFGDGAQRNGRRRGGRVTVVAGEGSGDTPAGFRGWGGKHEVGGGLAKPMATSTSSERLPQRRRSFDGDSRGSGTSSSQ